MKNKLAALLFLSLPFKLDAKINHILIDINVLLETCTKAATKEVGMWNGSKYLAYMGKTPNKQDFFKSLEKCPALAIERTHNEDFLMPLILSDWLLGLQKNSTIKNIIFNYLDKSKISEIEKTVFKNISNMMLSPATFIDTQILKKEIVKIIHKLQKSSQYIIYIIGNWDKESEPFLIKLLQSQSIADTKHCVFSNKLKQLKPHDGYYNALIEHCDVDPKDCLVIDVEKKHIQGAKNLGMTTILIQGHNNISQLKNELNRHHIQV